MEYQKETIVYSAVLSATALFFILLPVIRGNLGIGAISILITLVIYFLVGFVEFWLGQKISGQKLVLKPVYWAAPLCFVVPFQISKFTGLNEVFPGAHFLLVVAFAFLVGYRMNQVTLDKDKKPQS